MIGGESRNVHFWLFWLFKTISTVNIFSIIWSQLTPAAFPRSPFISFLLCKWKQTLLQFTFIKIFCFCVFPLSCSLWPKGRGEREQTGLSQFRIFESWQMLVFTGHVSPKVWRQNLSDCTLKCRDSPGSSGARRRSYALFPTSLHLVVPDRVDFLPQQER